MLSWEEFPKVDAEFMNQDHEECLVLLQELLQFIDDESVAESKVDSRLEALGDHLKDHFAREESAMEETGFPPYYVHKTEHDSVLQQFQQAVSDWQQGRDRAALKQFAGRSFINWLETHALTMDMVTAQHIQKCRG